MADATSQADLIEVSTSITVNRPTAPKGRGRDFTLTASEAIPEVVVMRESPDLPSEVIYPGPSAWDLLRRDPRQLDVSGCCLARTTSGSGPVPRCRWATGSRSP